MDRMEEYKALRDAPEELPPALEGAVARARARARRRRLWRRISAPAGSAAAVFAAFVLLVNLSTPFALACGRVPVLKELAAAVAFSPSLKAAVEHDFIQYIGQSQTDNGVTMTVEYVIVDEKQVNIFFTLGSEVYTYLDGTPDLSLEDGSGAPASVQYSSPSELEEGGLRQITVDFTDGDVPNALRLDYRVDNYATGSGGASEHAHFDTPRPMPATPAAEFSFLLRFDPRFLQQGETIQLNQWLELDGQRLYVKNVEIYPTHVRLNLEDDESNSAWIKGLEFYLEDEKGNRYEKISNGITASGSTDSPFMPSHRLESSYFGDAEHLKLYITGAEWLDKNLEYVTVDLNTLEAHPQPPQITFLEVEEYSDDRVLVCRTPSSTAVFTQSLYTPDGEERPVGGWGFTIATEALENGDFLALEGLIDQTIHLGDYHWDTVTLALNWSRSTVLDTPLSLPLK